MFSLHDCRRAQACYCFFLLLALSSTFTWAQEQEQQNNQNQAHQNQAPQNQAPQNQVPQIVPSQPKQRLRIGLALSGGGALGLAEIGVLQWLEE
ncbi:MAG: hypothetical protein QOF94_801, partial [Acidobacteriaceae bacterium]